tara:strand:+ start:134 stop:478 length:345 start_codon:yes stop_codon:yes gene_type:complete
MNQITDIVFTTTWFLLLIWAIRTMARGYTANFIDPGENYRPRGMWNTTVTKVQHPEMEGVKPGDQLMGVTFQEKPVSCDLEEYKALQDRIEELRLELEDEDEEEDDDGDVIVRV